MLTPRWRIRLVAYGARLESVLGSRPRGFESPILRRQSRVHRTRCTRLRRSGSEPPAGPLSETTWHHTADVLVAAVAVVEQPGEPG